MARKVFISFLGTNNYLQTIYQFASGEKSKPVRFIQEALILSCCKDWTENDKIFIFCTEDASKINWEDNEEKFFNEKTEKNKEIEKIGLKRRLQENFKMNQIVEKVDIGEGFSEDEIWKIFDCVYGKLMNNDEVYFDVTHAFRSIPLFSTVLFNYARFMKDTNVVSIQYGAFEKLGPAYKVKELPIDKRIAPILDLTNIVRLQQYTDMANSLTTFGRIKRISQVLDAENSEITPIIQDLSKSIENFDNYLLSNRMNDIKEGKYIISIRNNIKSLRKLKIPTPIKNVIFRLNDEMKDFVAGNSNKNIEAAIDWCVKYKMLPQAYTLGQEYIITLLAEDIADKNPFSSNKKSKNERDFRMYVSSLCSISNEDVKNKNYRGSLQSFSELTTSLLQVEKINNLRQSFSDLGRNRNAVAHAKGDFSYNDLENEFSLLYKKCYSIVTK